MVGRATKEDRDELRQPRWSILEGGASSLDIKKRPRDRGRMRPVGRPFKRSIRVEFMRDRPTRLRSCSLSLFARLRYSYSFGLSTNPLCGPCTGLYDYCISVGRSCPGYLRSGCLYLVLPATLFLCSQCQWGCEFRGSGFRKSHGSSSFKCSLRMFRVSGWLMIFCKNERRYGDDEKGMWHRERWMDALYVRLELTFLDRCNVRRMEDLEWFQKVWFNYWEMKMWIICIS